ncbi:MAG TPA: WecB/TagA/CpsF family glycosyltransferase [Dehalococcoidia bacterium]|nr:WecB/TagA/CpsF family glycosyltransferase [Dehalococcoidia bacterium]
MKSEEALLESTRRVSLPQKTDILGIGVSMLTKAKMLAIVADAVRSGSKTRVAFCTVDTISQSQGNKTLFNAVNDYEVVSPDGMPLVWFGKIQGVQEMERVDGPNAMLAICEQGVPLGFKHYFYGSTEPMLEALEKNMRARFPGIDIVGSYSPPFRPLSEEERLEAAARINAARPDLVWIGLGMPKQELWVAENYTDVEAPVILAVGAAFGFHAGMVRRAPKWMQDRGLEWLFRLSQEPRRLWKRYLVGNTIFLCLSARQLLFRRRSNKTP